MQSRAVAGTMSTPWTKPLRRWRFWSGSRAAPVVADDVVVGRQQKAAGAAGGIAHRVVRPRLHDVDDRPDQFARREVLPAPFGDSCADFASRPS